GRSRVAEKRKYFVRFSATPRWRFAGAPSGRGQGDYCSRGNLDGSVLTRELAERLFDPAAHLLDGRGVELAEGFGDGGGKVGRDLPVDVEARIRLHELKLPRLGLAEACG